jgi:hypothetical protein
VFNPHSRHHFFKYLLSLLSGFVNLGYHLGYQRSLRINPIKTTARRPPAKRDPKTAIAPQKDAAGVLPPMLVAIDQRLTLHSRPTACEMDELEARQSWGLGRRLRWALGRKG